jgi:hypothetical protein
MAGKDKAREPVESKGAPQLEPGEVTDEALEEGQPGEAASAMNIARPATSLASPPQKEVGKVVVALLGDSASIPSVEEIERLNRGEQGSPPLMTVMQAVLKAQGGSMTIDALAGRVKEIWNRPFPASPYTLEEFMYVVARNADTIKVS